MRQVEGAKSAWRSTEYPCADVADFDNGAIVFQRAQFAEVVYPREDLFKLQPLPDPLVQTFFAKEVPGWVLCLSDAVGDKDEAITRPQLEIGLSEIRIQDKTYRKIGLL